MFLDPTKRFYSQAKT